MTLTTMLVDVEALQADLKSLVAPPGGEAAVRDLLDAQQRAIDATVKAADAARANSDSFRSLLDQATRFSEEAKADAYGINACGTAR